MPLYDYECQVCGDRKTVLRHMSERDAPVACDCSSPTDEEGYTSMMHRVMSVPSPMPSSADRPGRGRNP